MKSDLEKFIELYKGLGIELDTTTTETGFCITIEADRHKGITGYYGFCTDIEFDKDGKFIRQVFYE